VADDNVDFATGFAELLRMEGHAVHTVHDGAQALEAARRDRFDAAFLDIGMPAINGYALARLMRQDERTRHLLLVAVTGWGQALDRQLVSDAGFDHHLVKPIEFETAFRLLEDVGRRAA
jgi:CheY-like chemotaxis protein